MYAYDSMGREVLQLMNPAAKYADTIPFLDQIEHAMGGYKHQVNMLWHIADQHMDPRDMQNTVAMALLGDIESAEALIRIDHHWSETTGHLFTDCKLQIGGHDMMKIFKENLGRWLYFKMTIFPKIDSTAE